MLYNSHEQLTKLQGYYKINENNQARLEFIKTLEFKKQFDEIRKDMGNIPMLVIKEFLKGNG